MLLQFKRLTARRIEPILQTTATDCALACLAMVLRAHGSEIDREGLRAAVLPSVQGVSVSQIIAVAGGFGLQGRAARASLADLAAIQLPAILHWNFNHFVVLERCDDHEAVVIDPSKGRMRLSPSELSDHYTGIAIEFTRTPAYRTVRQLLRISMSDLWQRMYGVRQSIGCVSGLSLLIELLVLAPPLLFSLVVDQAVAYASLPLLYAILGAIGMAYVVVSAGELLRRYLLLSLGTQLTAQINLNLVQHLLRLPYFFFQQRRLNDLLSRVESTRTLKDTLTEGAVPVVVDGIFALFILVSLFVVLPAAGLICAWFFVMYATLKLVTYPKLRELSEKTIDTLSDERGQLMDSLRGIQTVKVHNGEAARLSAWHGANLAALSSAQDQQRLIALGTASKGVLTGLEFVALIWICASHVIANSMTLGMLFAVVALRQQFQDRAYPIVEHLQSFRLLRLRLERLADITTSAPETSPDATGQMMPFVRDGTISVRGISFRYAGTSPWILKDLDLDIAAGEFVAIKGKSGEGKSTLVRILLGLIPADTGTMMVDGILLNRGNIVAYRCSVGAVLQDDQLFSGTLFDNISGFDPDASERGVVEAAKLACIHDDIMNMPMSYFSLIGDMGSSLSGGQRQRILLARALYRQPRILFLDEGTANLDMACETNIVRNLKSLNISIVCVAHRARMLDEADRVLDLRDGTCHMVSPFSQSQPSVVSEAV